MQLHYVPFNLSLIACYADINVSQGSVETHARCGGIFNIHLTTNLTRNFPVKKIVNRLRLGPFNYPKDGESRRKTQKLIKYIDYAHP